MSTCNTTLSICIPHYNSTGEVCRALDSIIVQAGFAAGGIEVVIVDDASSDGSAALLEKYSSAYGLRLVRNENRQGLTRNWNRALSEGRGDYVMLLHQDDWLAENAVTEILSLFRDNHDLAMAAFGQIYHPADGSLTKTAPRGDLGVYNGNSYFRRTLTFFDIPAPSTVVFSRRHLARLAECYSSEFRYCSEMDLYIRLALAFPEGKFIHDSRILIHRGISQKRFSYLHPGYRILDFCRILKYYASLLDDRTAEETAYRAVHEQVRKDFKAINELHDLKQLQAILDDHVFQEWMKQSPENRKIAAPYLKIRDNLMNPTTSTRKQLNATLNFWPTMPLRDYLLSPIFILGFHHSGTRLLAKMLHESGIFQVVDRQTYEWGYIQDLNDRVLPGWNSAESVRNFNPHQGSFQISPLEIAVLLKQAGYQNDQPWGHKDPRTCGTISAWLEVYPEGKSVHIIRDPLDVLGTLPEGYSKFTPGGKLPQQELNFWSEIWISNLERVKESQSQSAEFVEIRFEDLCTNPEETLQRVLDGLRLPLPAKFNPEEINTRKIGVYQRWIKEGKLLDSDLEFLRRKLRSYREEYGYEKDRRALSSPSFSHVHQEVQM